MNRHDFLRRHVDQRLVAHERSDGLKLGELTFLSVSRNTLKVSVRTLIYKYPMIDQFHPLELLESQGCTPVEVERIGVCPHPCPTGNRSGSSCHAAPEDEEMHKVSGIERAQAKLV